MTGANVPVPSDGLPSPTAIIFDWDNTLVDTFPGIHAALNATFRAFGKPEWTLEESLARVRLSMRDSFPGIFGDAWEEAGRHFYDQYERLHIDRLVPAPHADRLLASLAGEGIPLLVVSNKNGSYLRKEADHLDWSGHFHRLVGATDAAEDKPAAAPVHMALEGTGAEAGPGVWFVGDADTDLICARNAGCTPVLLRKKVPGDDEFHACPPAAYFADCDALCKFIENL